jgi:hypothetical protein
MARELETGIIKLRVQPSFKKRIVGLAAKKGIKSLSGLLKDLLADWYEKEKDDEILKEGDFQTHVFWDTKGGD